MSPQSVRHPVRLGTRASLLALSQTASVSDALVARGQAADGIDICKIKTSGDKEQRRPLYDIGGKALFCKELDEALLNNSIDIAVHSAKDIPTDLPPGLVIGGTLPAVSRQDSIIFADPEATLDTLPEGAHIGTSSLRRQAFLKRLRPDLRISPLRGNITSRLKKLLEQDYDAIVLATAGIERLDLTLTNATVLTSEHMMPAAGQGIVALMHRAGDDAAHALCQSINDAHSTAVLLAERAFLDALQGTCTTPIGAQASLEAETLSLSGCILMPDGSDLFCSQAAGPLAQPEAIGAEAAQTIIEAAGEDHLERWRQAR